MLLYVVVIKEVDMNLEDYIPTINNFPKEGIAFKDVSPLLADKEAFAYTIEKFSEIAKKYKPTVIVGPEARGFVFGTALAYKLGLGFVMARKSGKLPGKTVSTTYALEYGEDQIEVPEGLIKKGDRVLIIDDLLATGGTIGAIVRLVEKCDATAVAALTLIELLSLDPSRKLGRLPHESLVKYR